MNPQQDPIRLLEGLLEQLRSGAPSDPPQAPPRKPGRGPAAVYVEASDEVFPTLQDAERELSGLAGLPAGMKMIANNQYSRGIQRYRCPYQRKKGWDKCPFAMRVEAGSDGKGFRIFRHEDHPPHIELPGAEGSVNRNRILCDEAVKVVTVSCHSGATARGTFKALREGKLLPIDKPVSDRQLKKSIYNLRHKVRLNNPSRPRPNSAALIDIDIFCREHEDVPLDPHEAFCLSFSPASDIGTVQEAKDSGIDMWYYFTTPFLLERGCNYSTLCMDYTHSLSYCPFPTVLVGGITPPGSFHIIMMGVTLHENSASIEIGLRALLEKAATRDLTYAPMGLLCDSAPCFTAGFSRVFGECRALGLSNDLAIQQPSNSGADGLRARLYCYVHMWRQTLRHTAPMLRNSACNKEQYEALRLELKHDVLSLQRVPEEYHFPILAKLLAVKWTAIHAEAWAYFSKTWLIQYGNWYQKCSNDIVPPTIGRTSNGVEGTNAALKRGGINVNLSLSSLLSEVMSALSDYSTLGSIEEPEEFKPSRDQVMHGFR
ncbi:hypothetical protein FOL47_002011, partial [Perkinsus chesapeaki]